ncbi:MAG: cytochrome c [Chromatiales bacterium]|jgi:mono/diheme cytochrome c family protein
MNRTALAMTMMLGLWNGAGAEEADPAAGKALLETHCFRCHGTEVYTREDRRVQNLSQLRNQVQRCDQMLGLKWFETDIENVTAYLNQAYYKF